MMMAFRFFYLLMDASTAVIYLFFSMCDFNISTLNLKVRVLILTDVEKYIKAILPYQNGI